MRHYEGMDGDFYCGQCSTRLNDAGECARHGPSEGQTTVTVSPPITPRRAARNEIRHRLMMFSREDLLAFGRIINALVLANKSRPGRDAFMDADNAASVIADTLLPDTEVTEGVPE